MAMRQPEPEPAAHGQVRYIARLAGGLASGPYAEDAAAFLAGAGIDPTARPQLAAVAAAGLTHEAASTLISALLRLTALASIRGR